MIDTIAIKNFQSLNDVELELAPLTVIVGKSSSGKSAFTRAVRTLTSNQRGDAFITHGQRTCTITAASDRGIASLTRGQKNEYTLIPSNSEKKIFTKLNGTTPEEVSEFIGIPSKDPLNYSNQFDMPYLLTASAGEVARTLGELTNVHVIFEAAREANRQRAAATATLKTRVTDRDTLSRDLDEYEKLPSQLEAISAAEAYLLRAHDAEEKLYLVAGSISTIRDAQEQLETLSSAEQELPDIQKLTAAHQRLIQLQQLINRIREYSPIAEQQVSEVPDISRILAVHSKLENLTRLIVNYSVADRQIINRTETLDECEIEIMDLSHQYAHTLREHGTCPTCGQSTQEIK